MKYIKLYESYKSNTMYIDEVKDKFTPYINWKMIEDIKDMSLEYLDMGLLLNITIFWNNKPRKEYLSMIKFSHNIETQTWFILSNFNKDDFQVPSLTYLVYLINDGYSKESVELNDRIKLAYPKEIIK